MQAGEHLHNVSQRFFALSRARDVDALLRMHRAKPPGACQRQLPYRENCLPTRPGHFSRAAWLRRCVGSEPVSGSTAPHRWPPGSVRTPACCPIRGLLRDGRWVCPPTFSAEASLLPLAWAKPLAVAERAMLSCMELSYAEFAVAVVCVAYLRAGGLSDTEDVDLPRMLAAWIRGAVSDLLTDVSHRRAPPRDRVSASWRPAAIEVTFDAGTPAASGAVSPISGPPSLGQTEGAMRTFGNLPLVVAENDTSGTF